MPVRGGLTLKQQYKQALHYVIKQMSLKMFTFYTLVNRTKLFVQDVVSTEHLTQKAEEVLTLMNEIMLFLQQNT